MKRLYILPFLLCLVAVTAHTQSVAPEIGSWILNLTGKTGYKGLPSNVQKVQYSDSFVYISCSCIPGYDIGPWAGNPNVPANQNFVFKITRAPQKNTGTPTATPLGHIGTWTNGVSIFNAKDARSYNNGGVWNQNAIVVEGPGFDTCLGHPQQNGEYHHHLSPKCLYNSRDNTKHSPIIGYAFDGFPIYGAYGFANANGGGGVVRMRSGYRPRSITDRTTLPNGTALQPSQYGPAISGQYVLGYYVEDYEYVPGLGDLDEHNGRQCVTPEYPGGTYAYFVTLDESGTAAYPYTLGLTYYGVVTAGDTGPGSGHVVPSEAVQTYSPVTSVPDYSTAAGFALWPNPATADISVQMPPDGGKWRVQLCNALGQTVLSLGEVRQGETATFPLAGLGTGSYLVRCQSGAVVIVGKVMVAR